jgi:hypothetical protein
MEMIEEKLAPEQQSSGIGHLCFNIPSTSNHSRKS